MLRTLLDLLGQVILFPKKTVNPKCTPRACPAKHATWKQVSPTLEFGSVQFLSSWKVTPALLGQIATADIIEDANFINYFLLPDEGDMKGPYEDEKTNTNKLCWCQLNVAMSPGNCLLKLFSPNLFVRCTGTNKKSFNGIKRNHVQSMKWAD